MSKLKLNQHVPNKSDLLKKIGLMGTVGGGGATQPLPRDGGMEELHRDPTVVPLPKVWTRCQKWKWC